MIKVPKVAIIGGGISGLSCAFFLKEAFQKSKIKADIALYEAEPHLGGVIRSHQKEGFVYEDGPDTFISEKPWAADLCKRLGLDSDLIGVRPEHQRSAMVHRGRLYPIPKGFYLMASPSIKTLAELPFVSWKGKLRMMMEPFIPAGGPSDDESVASFMRRRFGEEVLWRIGQPMIGGIYTGDPEKLSLEATFPKFREMERLFGSVVKGLRARAESQSGVSGPRYGLFLSLKGGMQTLVDSLRQHLEGTIHSGHKVSGIKKQGTEWALSFANGRSETVNAVCLAVSAPAAARLMASVSEPLAESLREITCEDAVTINFAFKTSECPKLPMGAGFVVPKLEGLPLVGVTFAHQKFDGRVPEGYSLIRCFIGGVYHREVLKYSTPELTKSALTVLRKLLGIQANPLWNSCVRYHQAMPQFHVGHCKRAAFIRDQQRLLKGFFLTGNYLSGVGIPDCVHEAQKTADTMIHFLNQESSKPIDEVSDV